MKIITKLNFANETIGEKLLNLDFPINVHGSEILFLNNHRINITKNYDLDLSDNKIKHTYITLQLPYIRKQNYFHSICYQYNNINELEKIKVKTIGLDIIDSYLKGECWLYTNWNNESKNIYLSKKIINNQEITILTLDSCHDFQYYIIFNNYLYYISNQTKLTKEQLYNFALNSNFKYDLKNKQLLATDKNGATLKIILNAYQQYIKFIKMNNYSQKFLPIIEQEIDEYINSYKKLIK